MVGIRVSVTGDELMFERTSGALRSPRPLLKQIGVLVLGESLDRLTRVLKQEEARVRSGRLTASLMVSDAGGGNADSVFELDNRHVVVGSNVPYARQVHEGGPIRPKPPNKALAIPLIDSLKRDELWPRDLDPAHEILEFVPSKGKAIGVLVDPENELGYGTDPLFALVGGVMQEPRPFLLIDEGTQEVIEKDLWPAFLGG